MRAVAAAAAVLVAASVALGALPLAPESARSKPRPFLVAGSVSGLVPGKRVPLRLTIKNPHRFPIRVVELRVRVGAGGAGCAARNLAISRLAAPVHVRARAKRRVRLYARLALAAPNACVGASFPLRYGGKAVRRR